MFGGVGYTVDRYVTETFIVDALRTRYGRPELSLGEESTYDLDKRTTFSQSLNVQPNLANFGQYRLDFEAALAIALNKTVRASLKFSYSRNSDPGTGMKPYDSLILVRVAASLE